MKITLNRAYVNENAKKCYKNLYHANQLLKKMFSFVNYLPLDNWSSHTCSIRLYISHLCGYFLAYL